MGKQIYMNRRGTVVAARPGAEMKVTMNRPLVEPVSAPAVSPETEAVLVDLHAAVDELQQQVDALVAEKKALEQKTKDLSQKLAAAIAEVEKLTAENKEMVAAIADEPETDEPADKPAPKKTRRVRKAAPKKPAE